MAAERTLTIIKPDAVAKGAAGQIIARFEQAGLRILAAKLVHLSPASSKRLMILPATPLAMASGFTMTSVRSIPTAPLTLTLSPLGRGNLAF